jgi:hypothetical protein
LQVCSRAGVDVALSALNIRMQSYQMEFLFVMIEVVAIAVNPIVTGQAVNAEIQGMGLQESCIHMEVTVDAVRLVKGGKYLCMTVVACEGGAIRFGLVPGEYKPKCIMREIGITQVDQGQVCPTMIGVAISAQQVGIILTENPVQRGWVPPLGSNIGVTDNAPVGHGGGAPEGGVTYGALAGDFSVRSHPAQRCSRQGIQTTRTE